LLYGMTNHLPVKVAEILEDWSDNIHTDEQVLTIDIEAFVDQYSSLALKDLSLTGMMSDLMAILRDHKLILPADLALLIKAYITMDGFGRHLNPEFNTLIFAAPYLQKVMAERYKPEAMAQRGWRNLIGVVDLLSSLPKDLRKLLRASRKGAFQIDINVKRLGQYVSYIDNAISRLTMVLPLSAESMKSAGHSHSWDYIYEPDAATVIDELLVRYTEALIYQAVAENMASEQSARMVAMKAATDNAGNLIAELKLVYNKTRQAAITKELSEIVSGAAAVG